jgi:hypothetical protein
LVIDWEGMLDDYLAAMLDDVLVVKLVLSKVVEMAAQLAGLMDELMVRTAAADSACLMVVRLDILKAGLSEQKLAVCSGAYSELLKAETKAS